MDYTIYNTLTGLIHTEGTSQGLSDLADIIINDGDSILEGHYDRSIYKIVDGEPTEYTPDIDPILRNQRNGLLTESDWTQFNDSPLTDAKKAEWATYRQALRDLPATNTATTKATVTWPSKPA
tara:strand:+ start:793 stop:1161 length:369 start_codon:yes stop_codon:yes gene_type:complete